MLVQRYKAAQAELKKAERKLATDLKKAETKYEAECRKLRASLRTAESKLKAEMQVHSKAFFVVGRVPALRCSRVDEFLQKKSSKAKSPKADKETARLQQEATKRQKQLDEEEKRRKAAEEAAKKAEADSSAAKKRLQAQEARIAELENAAKQSAARAENGADSKSALESEKAARQELENKLSELAAEAARLEAAENAAAALNTASKAKLVRLCNFATVPMCDGDFLWVLGRHRLSNNCNNSQTVRPEHRQLILLNCNNERKISSRRMLRLRRPGTSWPKKF